MQDIGTKNEAEGAQENGGVFILERGQKMRATIAERVSHKNLFSANSLHVLSRYE